MVRAAHVYIALVTLLLAMAVQLFFAGQWVGQINTAQWATAERVSRIERLLDRDYQRKEGERK